jgi:hypothetical protein
MLHPDSLSIIQSFLFRNGRLLERQLWEYFFGNGSKTACLKALAAYQNEDGGFGNGLEPDLICPASSAIAAETAIWYLELLDAQDTDLALKLVGWIESNQNKQGFIDHPPLNAEAYPMQDWWRNPDQPRIFSLAGMLKKWGLGSPRFFELVDQLFEQSEVPHPLRFYDYPYVLYLKYCRNSQADLQLLAHMVAEMPACIEANRDHNPLFSRYWFFAHPLVDRQFLEAEAAYFVKSIQEDGSYANPYPQLPWWSPIFLLDGLILLKKAGLLL